LIGHQPGLLALAHFALAIGGALLSLRFWRTGGVWPAALIVLWTIFVCVPGPATWLYGHMPPTIVHWAAAPMALAGLRAAWRLSQLTRKAAP
jgi:hypothetical protein